MKYPYYDFDVNLNPSCSVEDAVAMLLGWLRSEVCYPSGKRDGYGVPFEEVPYLDSLVYSLKDHLIDMRTEAMDALDEAYKTNQPQEVISKLMDDIVNRERLIGDAKEYISEIHDEVLKGDTSELTVDKKQTEANGETFITLASLNRWAKAKYGINIFESPVKPDFSVEETKKAGDTKLKNLELTLGLLVNAFADVNNSGYKKDNGEPIISVIAGVLATQAKQKLSDATGQSNEAIKDRIEAAMKEIKKRRPAS